MAITLHAGPQLDFVHVQTRPELTDRDPADRGSANIRPPAPSALADWIDLLARISHDLRTPLNAVIGFSDAMQNELFGPLGHARYQEYARHIRTSGDLLLKAAEDTLAMTSLLAAPKSATLGDLQLSGPLAEAVAGIAGEARERGITIECGVDDEVTVRGDMRLMPRALSHVLAAALARAVDGARIVLTTTATHGRVQLVIAVGPIGDDPGVQPHAAAERGLGREELSIWLARLLLDLQDCELRTRMGPDRLVMTVDLEQARQTDFFARRA